MRASRCSRPVRSGASAPRSDGPIPLPTAARSVQPCLASAAHADLVRPVAGDEARRERQRGQGQGQEQRRVPPPAARCRGFASDRMVQRHPTDPLCAAFCRPVASGTVNQFTPRRENCAGVGHRPRHSRADVLGRHRHLPALPCRPGRTPCLAVRDVPVPSGASRAEGHHGGHDRGAQPRRGIGCPAAREDRRRVVPGADPAGSGSEPGCRALRRARPLASARGLSRARGVRHHRRGQLVLGRRAHGAAGGGPGGGHAARAARGRHRLLRADRHRAPHPPCPLPRDHRRTRVAAILLQEQQRRGAGQQLRPGDSTGWGGGLQPVPVPFPEPVRRADHARPARAPGRGVPGHARRREGQLGRLEQYQAADRALPGAGHLSGRGDPAPAGAAGWRRRLHQRVLQRQRARRSAGSTTTTRPAPTGSASSRSS